ncbi:MAG: ATP-binding protein [Lachnospiraceae bacterium]|nr:ATP-binding protein [Lachnospiraceae bacterium]
MNHIISKLLLYGDLPQDSILMEMSGIFTDFEAKSVPQDQLVTRIHRQIKRILEVSTDYGFDTNLWQNYLTFLLITVENPFSITCEKVGATAGGSVNEFAKGDFRAFRELFDYDFGPIEEALQIDCFSRITHYHAISKKELMYNKNVSEKVQALSAALAQTKDEDEFFTRVTDFYKAFGVGMFGLNKAFHIQSGERDGDVTFLPINNMDKVMLDDLIGYEIQKKKLVDNTRAFVEGRKCNNVLLFGDSGTGKSTSIKAIVNQFYPDGLRMIEIYKHQFKDLSGVITRIKNRNYKFIIYMDDLSFEEYEVEYKFLKAVIEGGVETKPDNILIYATSNRRHLIKEVWSDRDDMEKGGGLHRSDTMEEKLSLVYRFGVTINYSKPSPKEFKEIVLGLAHRAGVTLPDEELLAEANKWELSHGGISGRTAQQFINYILSM